MRQTVFVPVPDRQALARLVERYGGAVSTALLDPSCEVFQVPGLDGAIGYRRGLGGCAVSIGDPVCAASDVASLLEAFRACFSRTVYAAASPRFAEVAKARGYASIEFGEELIFDPRQDPCGGTRARELRKKINRAQKAGVTVSEYRRPTPADRDLEQAMKEVASSWLGERRGPQIYIARIDLFNPPGGKRWFYARCGERIVGVLSMMHLGARGGYLLDHLLATPDAPQGTTEILVCAGLGALAGDGCSFATFGPAPAPALGAVHGLPTWSELLGRKVFAAVGRVFHLDSRTRYRQKFGRPRTESSYILVDPPGLGLREIFAVMRAFNVSLA